MEAILQPTQTQQVEATLQQSQTQQASQNLIVKVPKMSVYNKRSSSKAMGTSNQQNFPKKMNISQSPQIVDLEEEEPREQVNLDMWNVVLHLNIAHFDKCRKCCMFLSIVASVACHLQVSQTSNKSYCHDDDTKETLRIPQTLDLEEGE